MPNEDRQGDKVAKWLFDKELIDLDSGSEEPDCLEEQDEVAEVDWDTLFSGKRPKPPDITETDQVRDHDRSMLAEAPDDWRDAWRDPWGDEIGDDLIEEVLGDLGGRQGQSSHTEDFTWDWDVAAWYQQIHFFGYDWGIYIKENALIRQARYIGSYLPSRLRHQVPRAILVKTLLRASVASYFLHEQYHHKVECLGIRFYVVENQSRYAPYWKQVYRLSRGTNDLLEEALANADSYRRLADKPYSVWLPRDVRESTKTALEKSFHSAPLGYREATRYLDKGRFEDGENRLHGMVQEATLRPIRTANDWNFAPRLMQSFFKINDGIWTVVPVGQRRVLPTKAAPVRVGSSRDVVKLLTKIGYTIVPAGGKGSHIKLSKPGCRAVTVPANRENLSPGVGRNIAAAIGLHSLGRLQIALAGTVPIEQLM